MKQEEIIKRIERIEQWIIAEENEREEALKIIRENIKEELKN